MSLNGLDDADVTAAYQTALGEPGGWFLLKYTSRDSVDIFTRGTGGATEARGAIATYEEKSPLYGFLLYRRRKVLIKCVPEGTSRLLQARVAVHFTAITEKFTPHDATFSIATADELSDGALTSACSLHTAAPSSSSSTSSSHRHKLDEIIEDAEEGQSSPSETASTARPATATAPVEGHTAENSTVPESNQHITAEDVKPTPEPSHTTQVTADQDELPLVPNTAPLADAFKNYDSLFENGPDPRLSSQTARPAISDLYAEIYAQYNKPKVKLGPRPKASLDIKRPHTSGSSSQSVARPISTLPAGLRAANRKTETKRPKSRDASTVPTLALPPPPPIPTVPDIPVSPMHPPKSPASVKSLPANAYSSLSHKSHGVTPEKQRLMRALEMRKKHMKAKQEREAAEADAEAGANVGPETVIPSESVKETEFSTRAELPIDESNASTVGAANSTEAVEFDTLTTDCKEVVTDSSLTLNRNIGGSPSMEDTSAGHEQSSSENARTPFAHDEFDAGATPTQTEPDDVHSAASPISAQTQGSSCAPSTRPSSISEDDPIAAQEPKLQISKDSRTLVDESLADEKEDSVESTPTVVPENLTPIPSVEVYRQADEPSVTERSPRKKKRESMVFQLPADLDDARARRRSKRESMILPLSGSPEEGQSRMGQRISMMLSTTNEPGSSDGKEKRRLVIDPTHLSAESSEAEYLSDDSFMEELQSAKFEEAKPVSVSKSPITPFFPRKSSTGIVIPQRSASQQSLSVDRTSPDQSGPRKLSGPWLTHANTDTVVVAKKINVSSGISQRIKALAEKSNRDSSASLSPFPTPDAGSSFVAQRRSSFFATPPEGNSPNAKTSNSSRISLVNVPRSVTPEKKSTAQPLFTTAASRGPHNRQQDTQPESVQVTARIVRDSRPQPAPSMPTEHTPLELHQSPIIIDHQKSVRPPSSSRQSPIKAEATISRPPSSSTKEATAALPRSSSESSWRSFGRRMSESRSGGPPRSLSAHSLESSDEKAEKKEKKDSRASKLFKRMSSISSITRKSSSAPITPEEDLETNHLPSLREPPSPVQVGDLNIQFPDTLLWKRRWVEVDTMGNLVLSLSKSNEQSKGITKRFHLTEFRAPYAPDLDQQELPNSVILDFLDGRTLQCACTTYAGQAQVLQILREAHEAWIVYNQAL